MADRVLQVQFVGDSSKLGSAVDGIGHKFSGMKVAAGVAAAGAGAAIASGIASTISFDAAQKKLQAQLGDANPMASKAGEVAGSLYSQAYGENLGQVNDAVRSVIQSGALMENASTNQIEGITASAMSLAQAFDLDVSESMRAVSQLVKTNLVPNATAGMDLITSAFQKFGPHAQDVLDTVTEYSTQFRKLGIDGPQAMGLISQGLKAGARDTDTIADALKEFSIRAVDGSKATAEGFKAIGLNADEMAKKFAQGGPVAQQALDVVIDRLRGMKDPLAQSQAAVALFGTKAEDLGAALYALDPSSAVAAMGDVAGAASRLDQTIGDTAQAKITAMQRSWEQFSMSLVSAKGPLGDVSAAVLAFAPGGLDIAGNLAMMAVAFRGVGIASLFTAASATAAWTAITGPVGLVIAVIALVAAGVYLIYKNWDTITAFFSGMWSAVTGAFSAAWGWIAGIVQSGIDRVRGYIYWLSGLAGLIGNWFAGMANAAAGRIGDLINWVAGIPGRVLGALGNLASMLYNAGVSLISGFLEGLVARWNQLMAWARSAMASLRALWPFSPAKEGPFSGRGYVTYSGAALTADFAASIVKGMPAVVNAVRGMMGAAQGEFAVTPLTPSPSGSTIGASGGGAQRLIIDSAGTALDDLLLQVLRNALRDKGLGGILG